MTGPDTRLFSFSGILGTGAYVFVKGSSASVHGGVVCPQTSAVHMVPLKLKSA